MHKIFHIAAVLIIVSCASVSSVSDTARTELDVSFDSYLKNSFFETYADDKDVNFEEWRDTVEMTVLTHGKYFRKIYHVIIGENPVRSEFLTRREIHKILISGKYLEDYDGSGFIVSGDIIFK